MIWRSRILGWFARREPRLPDGASEARIKSRPIMDRVLKEIFVPELRERGFTGSFPHFRRIRPDRIDLISLYYPKRTGQFVVELSQCGPAGIKIEWDEDIPPGKVTANDTHPGDRVYLRAKAGWRGELAGWRGKLFVFDRPTYDPPIAPTEAGMEASCVKAAKAALAAFAREAEPWWEKKAAGRAGGAA